MRKIISDDEFRKIPAVRQGNEYLRLLEAMKELHSGELFCEIKLTDIADAFSSKMGEKFSSLKVSATIRSIFGDSAILKRGSNKYYAVIQIDTLNKLLNKYEKWRV